MKKLRIVAVPADATNVNGTWMAADGTQIGPDIWGRFAVVQEAINATGTGDHGVSYVSPYSARLGKFSPTH